MLWLMTNLLELPHLEYSYGYRPYFEEGHVSIEEGSGDSEESIDVKNNNQKSAEKRKRGVVCKTTKKKKNFKPLPQSDAISKIVSASESRSTIMSTFLGPGASIREVMAEIQKIETITNGSPENGCNVLKYGWSWIIGLGNRMIQEIFQYSKETVSRHFHEILVACLRLFIKYIKLLDP
ncbi:hypothetical protein S83_007403, partial [Arachis hypogaea]